MVQELADMQLWRRSRSCGQGAELQSVLSGAQGAVAMISGDLLTEGQDVKGWTVRSIAPREVVLAREGLEYVLQMPK